MPLSPMQTSASDGTSIALRHVVSSSRVLKTNAPVQGRACGFCTVCCYLPTIDTPELQKPPGIVCPNCTGRGCGIYETRPMACRDFNCGWWHFPQLRDEWRPDKSGILILTLAGDAPGPGSADDVQLVLVDGEEALLRPGVAEFVLALVQDGIPTYVAAPGPPGMTGARTHVNEVLADVARRNDGVEAVQKLVNLYRQAASAPPRPASMSNGPA
jgi:hypothetical protein